MTTVINGDSNISLNFSTGGRITGDFSNATVANRALFQSSTTNGATRIGAIPNGTGVISEFTSWNSSDTANAAIARTYISSTEMGVASQTLGTGSYVPMVFYTGGSERMRIDTAGNIGIGTSSPSKKFAVSNGGANGIEISPDDATTATNRVLSYNRSTAAYTPFVIQGSNLYFFTTGASATESMRIDSSGHLLLGGTSGNANAMGTINAATGTVNSGLSFYRDASYGASIGVETVAGQTVVGSTVGSFILRGANMLFSTGGSGAEVGRFDTSGNLLVGANATVNSAKFYVAGAVADRFIRLENSSGSPSGQIISYTGAAPNNTASEFLLCNDTGGTRAAIRSNGGLANYSANNANLSDERTKTNIQDAGGYLAKICAIPVRTFKYKDQTDDLLNLGVIAQEVEAVAPELVDVSGFGETPEDGIPLKAIYQTDLQYALMKCIQEQQAIIQQLQADVEQLKGNQA